MAEKNKKKTKDHFDTYMNLSNDIIHNKKILNLFVDHLKKIGAVGAENVAKLHYLALTSRFFKDPVSVVVKGSSAAGKSFVLEQVLKHFPKEAYLEMSAATEKALVVSDLDLKHKFLIIEEAEAFTKEFFNYTIRGLLSAGKFIYKTQKKIITLKGPTGLITTTTKSKLTSFSRKFRRFLTKANIPILGIIDCQFSLVLPLPDITTSHVSGASKLSSAKALNTRSCSAFCG